MQVLELEGWQEDLSIYAVILRHFSARRGGKDSEAKSIVDEAVAQCDASAWPFPIIRYLRGELDERALFVAASDSDKTTDVRCFLGVELLVRGKKEAALTHFRWVKEHGDSAVAGYDIALAELDRLEQK
jgi:hypothetical protein